MRFRQIFHDATWKALRLTFTVVVLGLCIAISAALIEGKSDWHTVVVHLLQELTVAFFTAAVLAVTVEIGLRQELLQDIENTFKASQGPNFVKLTARYRQDLNPKIAEDVIRMQPGETLRTIGTTEGTFLTNFPGRDALVEKIARGCHFQMLVLHPESALLDCIQNESRTYGTSNLRASVGKTLEMITLLASDLAERPAPRGSIEIRMHKDVLSAGYYYSSATLTLFSPYLAHKRGVLCPAILSDDQEYLADLRNHFEALWRHGEKHVVLRVDSATSVNQIDRYAPAVQ